MTDLRVLELPTPSTALPTGPEAALGSFFISGTVLRPYRLGQRVTSEDLSEEVDDGTVVGRKFGGGGIRKSTGGKGGGGTGPGSGFRGSISLADLVEAGVLVAGRGKITCTYKGQTVSATLTDDGCIEYQGKRYQSATAFSISFKRTITPSKQGDDGWKSVLYDGKPLEHYRKIVQDQKKATAEASGAATPTGTAGDGFEGLAIEGGPSSGAGGGPTDMAIDEEGQGVGAADLGAQGGVVQPGGRGSVGKGGRGGTPGRRGRGRGRGRGRNTPS